MKESVKGEVKLMLAGEQVTLRPSFDAMIAIEEQLGVGLLAAFTQLSRGNIGFKNITAVIYGGLIGSGHMETFEVEQGKQKRKVQRHLSFNEVGERVRISGINTLLRPASSFLAECIRGEMPRAGEEPKAEGEGTGEAMGAAKSSPTSDSPSEATTE